MAMRWTCPDCGKTVEHERRQCGHCGRDGAGVDRWAVADAAAPSGGGGSFGMGFLTAIGLNVIAFAVSALFKAELFLVFYGITQWLYIVPVASVAGLLGHGKFA